VAWLVLWPVSCVAAGVLGFFASQNWAAALLAAAAAGVGVRAVWLLETIAAGLGGTDQTRKLAKLLADNLPKLRKDTARSSTALAGLAQEVGRAATAMTATAMEAGELNSRLRSSGSADREDFRRACAAMEASALELAEINSRLGLKASDADAQLPN
jgi:hypothetical protein